MAKKPTTVFVCQECGSQSPKWLGRCGDCGAWNSLVEERAQPEAAAGGPAGPHRYAMAGTIGAAQLYADIEIAQHSRLTTGIDEFDRVLGGGVVPGSLILLGGEPGIGKSTLLLQAAANMANSVGPVLYSSGEESEHQIKSRGERLNVGKAPLYLLAETCLERILEEIARIKPALVLVDSVQTIFSLKFQSAPGSIGQVREAATQFLFMAKGHNIPTFLLDRVEHLLVLKHREKTVNITHACRTRPVCLPSLQREVHGVACAREIVCQSDARLRIWQELHRELATRSPRAVLIVAPHSGHYIQNDEPSLVIEAVRRVVANARSGSAG